MTKDQLMGLLRQVLPLIAGIAVGKGWLTVDQAGTVTTLILQIIGPLGALGGMIWAAMANSKSSIIQSVAAMPETKVISTGVGGVTSIEIHSPDLASKASEAATPLTK